MVSEWRSGFRVEGRDGATVVRAHSEFRPKNLLVRMVTPMVERRFHRAQRAILLGLKTWIDTSDRGRGEAGSTTTTRGPVS
jgi:hypothetical protein